MIHRTLYYLARFAEIPLIVLAIMVALIWLNPLLGTIVGYVIGRTFYFPLKLGFTISIIGSGWNKAFAEMLRFDPVKVSYGGHSFAGVLIYFPLGILLQIIGSFTDIDPLMWFGFILASLAGTNLLFATMPAAILFLGRSSRQSNTFLWELRKHIFPLRVTSLLNAQSSGDQFKGPILRRLNDYDNVRVGDADDWKKVVMRFARVTPILILDAREDSEAVAAEIELLRQSTFYRKTLVIVSNNGRTAAIDGAIEIHKRAEYQTWRCCNSSNLLAILAQIGRDPKTFASLFAHPGNCHF